MILVFALSASVYAADSNPSVTVQYKYGNFKSGSFSLSSSNASYTGKVSGYLSYTSGTVAVDDYSGSTTVFELSRVPSDFSVSTSTPGYSVSYSLSDGTATIVVTADSSRESNLCGLDFSGESYVGSELKSYVLGSGYSYTGSGTPPVVPPNPYEGTGSMFGWTGCSLNCLNRKNGILMVLVLLLLLSLILFGLVWMVRELSEVKSLILKCLRL